MLLKSTAGRDGAAVQRWRKGSDWNDTATSRGDDVAQKMLSGTNGGCQTGMRLFSAERLTTTARTREMEAERSDNQPDDAEHAKQQSKKPAEMLTDATTRS